MIKFTFNPDEMDYETSWWMSMKNILDLRNAKEMIMTCLKDRPGNYRLFIWLLLTSTVTIMISNEGYSTVLFQYTQKAFNWDAQYYGYVISIGNPINSLIGLISVPIFSNLLKVSNAVLALIGTFSMLGQNLIRGMFDQEMAFYLSYIVGGLGSTTMVGLRSLICILCDRKESGKLFSLLATLEALTPFFGSFIGTQIFNATIDYYAGMFFLVAAGVLIYPMIVFCWIDLVIKTD